MYMIVLTSNGLSSNNLLARIQNEVSTKQHRKATIIVTADHEYKQNNWHVPRLMKELQNCGLEVSLFDFDTDDIALLEDVDVIEINGGNPYYLLDRMRKASMSSYLDAFVAQGKLLIGMSAGSFVLQQTIELVNEYSSDMNFLFLDDLKAMGLVDIEVLPHYDRFRGRFDQFEERCQEYETKKQIKVIRINDGDGVIFYEGNIEMIRG